ncbi:MAG TPA: glycosyltransferase family 4 protein [Bryobacteraceae bacterium]|nr:glycosyltransferase family 4 protein [Bryobacteraceae bacterium]
MALGAGQAAAGAQCWSAMKQECTKWKPRVLLTGTFLSVHGGSRSPIEDLAERLTGAGHKCVCASSFRSGAARTAHLLLTIAARRPSYDVAVVDLFSGNAFLWGEAAGALLRALRVPFVYALHGGALPEFSATRKRRVASCLARAAAVVAPSAYLLDRMQQYRSDASLMPNPLSITEYPFRFRQPARPKIVWVRRFNQIYNPAMAPAVVAELARRWPDVHLTMVGGDTGDGSLERTHQAAANLGVTSRITFTGAVARDRVREFLNQADVFLNTTDIDNTPLSVLEAMACGLCVVSTNPGGVPYLLRDGIDGLLVPCRDASAAAAAVDRVVSNPELARGLSARGRAQAETFDWAHVLPQWERLLSGLGTRASRPALGHGVGQSSTGAQESASR